MKELFFNVCLDLWAGDVAITYDIFRETVGTYIRNLESHIGEDAHKHLADLGVIDETGMTWEEQDEQTKKQIDEYKKLLDYLEMDENWTY